MPRALSPEIRDKIIDDWHGSGRSTAEIARTLEKSD